MALAVCGRASAATVALVGGVAVWWLLIVGAIVLTVPTPATSTPKPILTLALGQTVHVNVSGLSGFAIPVERRAYDEAKRGFRESDEEVIEWASGVPEWFEISDRQLVRIIDVDVDDDAAILAVQVELLGGRDAWRRGWVEARQLGP